MKMTWMVGWAVTAQGAEVQVFFGNLHSHTSFSDGSGKPDDAFKAAKKAGLHFLAVTEHNHDAAEKGLKANDPRKDGILIAKTPALYNGAQSDSVISAARRRTVPGQFVAIYGQEFSTISSGNHANVFEVAEVIDEAGVANGDFKALVAWLVAVPAAADAGLVASKNSKLYHVSAECRLAKAIKDGNRVTGAEARNGRAAYTGCPLE